MTVLVSEVRPGVYHDSIVLMQLHSALAELPGVLDAGAVMASPENLTLLEANGLLPAGACSLGPSDLLVVVRAESDAAATEALRQLDSLLARQRASVEEDFRPRSLASALKRLPEARWVLVSVPGRFAAAVAREALEHDRHVFLFSDNVSLQEETALKRAAREKGLLVMGPDCGTAIVGGVGFGFANRVRRGPIGLVAASGTGLQAVSCHIHALGSGISHAIGTGGRDPGSAVGAVTALQALDLLRRDSETEVIVLISKPPEPEVAKRLLAEASKAEKPVVVYFQSGVCSDHGAGNLRCAGSLAEAATLAVGLSVTRPALAVELPVTRPTSPSELPLTGPAPPVRLSDTRPALTAELSATPAEEPGYLRGLFAGGTLALEALLGVRVTLRPVHSNLGLEGVEPLSDVGRSEGHTILDLGSDEFTAGRPHPMLDNELRIRRLRQEAADPKVGVILLDVVLGEGAHPDPAGQLAPIIADVRRDRREARHPDGTNLEVVAIVIGTDEDPQGLGSQVESLERAGVRVFRDTAGALAHALRSLGRAAVPERPLMSPAGDAASASGALAKENAASSRPTEEASSETAASTVGRGAVPLAPGSGAASPVSLDDLHPPVAAVNVGLETFYQSLVAQGASAIQVDWRPAAGGNERLMKILEKMKG
ncbi:MAG: acyl-CoA synthetase FdrA [Gemmatimonadota bacterium]